jgi:hypothetical protein
MNSSPRNEQANLMHRNLYGHDCKPPSNAIQNLLVGIVSLIILIAFVWATYDVQTFRMLSGVRPEVKNMQPVAEPQRVDVTERNALRDKSARR